METRTGESPQEARRRLLQLLEEGATGCLSGVRGTVEYRIYLMNGDLLAAHAESDSRRILEIVRNLRLLGAPEIADLQRRLAAGEALSDLLVTQVGDEKLSRVLYDRFRENLFEFTSFASNISFEPMEAIFVDNIQLGHDSLALVAELDGLRERLASAELEPDQMFRRGRTHPAPGDEQTLLDTFRDQISVEELLRRSPFERSRTLVMLLDMQKRGMLFNATPIRGEALPATDPERRATPVSRNRPPLPLSPPALPPVRRDEEEAPTAPGISPSKPSPIPPHDVGHEYLDAFQDGDTNREGGEFSTQSQHLDRVEIDNPPPKKAPSFEGEPITNPGGDPKRIAEPIELEDADGAGKEALKSSVTLSFGGRQLDEADIARKMEVVNEVLGTLVAAMNHAQPGIGNAQLQLLLEGAPAPFAPLFKGVEARAGGRLPAESVIKNLRRRPASEQRQLLNNGLENLIERALSITGDTLDDDSFEEVLQQIVGYQQKFVR